MVPRLHSPSKLASAGVTVISNTCATGAQIVRSPCSSAGIAPGAKRTETFLLSSSRVSVMRSRSTPAMTAADSGSSIASGDIAARIKPQRIAIPAASVRA